jgi:hypothetical protein
MLVSVIGIWCLGGWCLGGQTCHGAQWRAEHTGWCPVVVDPALLACFAPVANVGRQVSTRCAVTQQRFSPGARVAAVARRYVPRTRGRPCSRV